MAAAAGDRILTCQLCKITVQPTCWSQHLLSKKHLKLLHIQNRRKNSNARTVSVTGFKPGTTDLELASYFGKFETVTNINLDKDNNVFAFVEFQESSALSRIMSSRHKINGNTLEIQLHQKKTEAKPISITSRKKLPAVHETSGLQQTVIKELCELQSVDAQVYHLMKRMSLDAKDQALREHLRSNLEHLLQEFFPDCSLTPYGSSANNLGKKEGSDLDLHLDFGFEEPISKENEDAAFSRIMKNLPRIRLNNKDPTYQAAVRKLQRKKLVILVSIIIRRYAAECISVFPVVTARCPIVQFVHRNSGLKCDISMRNRLALMNTELTILYQKLDPRVGPLIFAIRCWCKKTGITFSSMRRLSSYAVTMLVVFYLQNCVPRVLPTVEHLQLLTDESQTIDGWRCHFCRDINKIAKTGNTDSIETLLKGFFQFYVNVDFKSTVLCLHDGTMVPMEQFKASNDYDMMKFQRLIHIQDPFELVHNIGRSASIECSAYFTELIKKTHDFFTSETSSFPKKPCSEEAMWGLAAFLNEASDQLMTPKRAKQKPLPSGSRISTSTTQPVKDQPSSFEFDVMLSENVVFIATGCSKLGPNNENKSLPVESTSNEEHLLRSRLAKKIREIFSKALMFECHEIVLEDDVNLDNGQDANVIGSKRRRSQSDDRKASPSKVRKVKQEGEGREEITKVVVQQELQRPIKIFECQVSHRTWVNRKSSRSELVKTVMDAQMKQIDLEEAISKHIINSCLHSHASSSQSAAAAVPRLFSFVCSLHPLRTISSSSNQCQTGLTVKLSIDIDSKEFKGALVTFLKSYVQKLVNQTFLSD